MTHPGSVDFLVVTALREETEAVANLLEEKQSKASDIIGKITRESATSKYDVALTEIAELGNINAQATTREALSRNDPRYVILTGIAAGFPEAGIMMGDVLVPYAIAPYELAKITEVAKPRPNRLLQTLYSRFGKRHDPHFKVEHRTIPTPVSYPLWHFASSLARNLPSGWTSQITAVRPDGSIHKPTIHCKSNSILGSGEKIVASEYAEARKWLLTQFPGQAMGLEMESYGTLSACRVTDTPFLAIKASQDPATRQKDIPDQKDRWRAYATQAAAAFTVLLIRNFELQNDALILGHTKDSRDVARIFNREAPEPRFSYLVNRSRSYGSLKAGIWELSRRDPDILIPNDVTPAVVLHGGGGTGKTTILKSLMARLAYEDVSPVFVDLRRWSQAVKGQLMPDKRDLIDEILREGSMPRRTKTEIEQLAKELRLAMLIDGLNEVSRESRTRLLDYFRGLNLDGRCYLLISDRFGPAESLETFAHAEVERLESTFVESIFDTTFGRGSFAALNDRLKKIYSRPFFLSLALRTRRKFSESNRWTAIFDEFFLQQLGLASQDLDLLSKASLKSIGADGISDVPLLKQMTGPQIYDTITSAEVLNRDGVGFEHHLWRDYLVSRYFSLNFTECTDENFDTATTFASSLECLSLTVEQLSDRSAKDQFLKRVFDWNYFAAAACIADFKEDEPVQRQLSRNIREAILAAIAEKKFDRVERTRRRANETLQEHRYELAQPFREAASLEALREHVAKLEGLEDWFIGWRSLFSRTKGQAITSEEFEQIGSNDSIIGWATANLARRSKTSLDQQQIIRETYYSAVSDGKSKQNVRWRVVHVLGMMPSENDVELLSVALRTDEYHWVQYGAVRALMEIAADSPGDLRSKALASVQRFIKEYNPSRKWVRRQILREVIETAFIQNPGIGWKDDARPMLALIVDQESDLSYKAELKTRLSEFENYK